MAELAARYDVHPNRDCQREKQAPEGTGRFSVTSAKRPLGKPHPELRAKIGELGDKAFGRTCHARPSEIVDDPPAQHGNAAWSRCARSSFYYGGLRVENPLNLRLMRLFASFRRRRFTARVK